MIDVHSHIIPNVDDGSKSVEETFNMLKEAESIGFTDIIATSHYLPNYYETDSQELVFWKDKLQELIKKCKANINLHSGMEIYVTEQMYNLIIDNKLLRLANSRYMLIELPMNSSINYLDHIIYYLDTIGVKFILAHPERYRIVQEKPELVEEYVEKGCLMQCNFGSILGMYGSEPKKVMKHLLKKDLVHFVASDCHNKGGVYLKVPKAV